MQFLQNKKNQIILTLTVLSTTVVLYFLTTRMSYSEDAYIFETVTLFFISAFITSLISLIFSKNIIIYWVKATLTVFIPVSLMLIFGGRDFQMFETQPAYYSFISSFGVYILLVIVYLYFKNKKIKQTGMQSEDVKDLKNSLLTSNYIFFLSTFVITTSIFIQVALVKEFNLIPTIFSFVFWVFSFCLNLYILRYVYKLLKDIRQKYNNFLTKFISLILLVHGVYITGLSLLLFSKIGEGMGGIIGAVYLIGTLPTQLVILLLCIIVLLVKKENKTIIHPLLNYFWLTLLATTMYMFIRAS